MRYLRVLPAVALLATSVGHGPAGAQQEAEAGCVSGPASRASVERPHLLDPEGDVHHPAGPLAPWGEDAYDITAVWVSQEDDPEPGEPATFAANIAVAGFDGHPVSAAYYVHFTSFHWASARALVDGSWEFRWGIQIVTGPFIGYVREAQGETTGTVDLDAGVVSILLPGHLLPQPRADGQEVVLPTLVVRDGTAVAAPVSQGSPQDEPPTGLVSADTTSNAEVCTIVLYEERDLDEDDD